MMTRNVMKYAGVAALGLCLTAGAHAATVVNVQVLAPDAEGNFVKPTGLLTDGNLDQMLTSETPGPHGGSLRGWRDNTQTFTIDAEFYADGISLTAFAINFRDRHETNDPDFGVRLYRVDGTDPNNMDGADLVFNPMNGTGSLKYPSAGVATEGTYIFHFDEAVTLLPGVYAWQFLTGDTGSNNSSANPVWWVTQAAEGDVYDGGTYFQRDTPASAPGGSLAELDGRDATFGLIGTVIPEPASLALLGAGGLLLLRRRK